MIMKTKIIIVALCLFLLACGRKTDDPVMLKDGLYEAVIELEGGTGRATVNSPCIVRIENGKCYGVIEWSSPNYDYMIVGEEQYLPINTEGNSVFEIPVVIGEPFEVIADTVAMSTPHEIEYSFNIHSLTEKD